MNNMLLNAMYASLVSVFLWFGAMTPTSMLLADNCRGKGSQDPLTGKLSYGCVGGTCTTGACTTESDTTSAPGFTIEFCTCRHPDTTLDCDFTTRECVLLRVTDSNGIKSFWCKECDCPDPNATEPMYKIKGECVLAPATAFLTELCTCPGPDADEE